MRIERWDGEGPPHEGTLRAQLEREGYAVYAWTDAPGATYPPHAHAEDQSHWIVRGALSLTVDARAYVLEPGDRDWLPAGTVHSARVAGSAPVTYLIGAKPATAPSRDPSRR